MKTPEIAAAQTDVDHAKEQHRVDTERFQMRIEDVDAKLMQSKQQNVALQSQVDRLKAECQRLDALAKDLCGREATKEAQIERLEADLIAAHARHEKLDAVYQQAHETIAALTSERDDWLTSAIATKNHNMGLREQMEEQRETELEQWREDARLLSLEAVSLQMANKRLADDAAELNLELTAASSARRAQDEALVVLETEYAALVKNTNAMIQRIQEELADTRQTIEQERHDWAVESRQYQLMLDDAHSKMIEATARQEWLEERNHQLLETQKALEAQVTTLQQSEAAGRRKQANDGRPTEQSETKQPPAPITVNFVKDWGLDKSQLDAKEKVVQALETQLKSVQHKLVETEHLLDQPLVKVATSIASTALGKYALWPVDKICSLVGGKTNQGKNVEIERSLSIVTPEKSPSSDKLVLATPDDSQLMLQLMHEVHKRQDLTHRLVVYVRRLSLD